MGGMLHTTKNYSDCIKRMAIFGISLVIIGKIWGLFFPINKALWTSPYVLYTGGIGAVVGGNLDSWFEELPLAIRFFGNGYMIPMPTEGMTGFGNIGASLMLVLKRGE